MGKKIEKQSHIKLEHIEPTAQPSSSKSRPQHKTAKIQQKPQTSLKRQEKRQENVQSEKKSEANVESTKKTKKIKHARLIIRNLVFDINEKHIKKLISPFGEVKQISIPKHPDRNTTRGFAFVEMSNKNQCLKAIKKLNGTQYKGRPIVLDLAVSKQNFMTEKLKEGPKQTTQPKEQQNQKEEQMQNQENPEKLKKQQAQQESENQQQNQQQGQDQKSEQELSEGQRQQKQKEDHKYEIFIRNLPISTTQDDLYKQFVRHGRIKFVRICKNKETGVSKGTAFIKFYDAEVPQKLIHQSRSYEMFLLKKIVNFVPDPNIKLEIDGMIMKIFPVESRKQIEGKLKDRQGENKTEKKAKPIKKIKKLQDLVKIDTHDKRKLSLALLGRWKAQQNMNQNDFALLKSHEKEKIVKLKNPNSSVSSTRIILKHLDKTITQQEIRTICFKFLAEHNLNKSALTYCKLMLDRDMKKSAGFAFVEFKKHEIAKDFLDMLVKNPQIVQKRLYIVQFAIQDSRKMLKLAKRNLQGKQGDKKDVKKAKKAKQDRTPGKKPSSNERKPKKFKKKFIKK